MDRNWLPARLHTEQGQYRRVGVELEFAGVDADGLCSAITSLYGGNVEAKTPLEYRIKDTRFGDFVVELDASSLKQLAEKHQGLADEPWLGAAADWAKKAAEQLVPWEIVSPPIPMTELKDLQPLVTKCRQQGAKGTRHALHYAFGVHLNPELPDFKNATIVNYLRAFFCLYDWIASREKIDTTRRITTYISHFGRDYQQLVLEPSYKPTQAQLIDDYLRYNPTRNRSLDMLPLFAFLDEKRVLAKIDDQRVQKRPTFHYRLPNCDIDNPRWNLSLPWGLWLMVEALASDTERLVEVCAGLQKELQRVTFPLEQRWLMELKPLVQRLGYAEP